MTIFTKTDKPIVRIYPLPFNPDEYADDSEFTREYNYQIDIWWSEDEPNEQAEKYRVTKEDGFSKLL